MSVFIKSLAISVSVRWWDHSSVQTLGGRSHQDANSGRHVIPPGKAAGAQAMPDDPVTAAGCTRWKQAQAGPPGAGAKPPKATRLAMRGSRSRLVASSWRWIKAV